MSHSAWREALLTGANDSAASSCAVIETNAQVAGLEDAIASLDQQIADVERSLCIPGSGLHKWAHPLISQRIIDFDQGRRLD
jgi:hypothetical protein